MIANVTVHKILAKMVLHFMSFTARPITNFARKNSHVSTNLYRRWRFRDSGHLFLMLSLYSSILSILTSNIATSASATLFSVVRASRPYTQLRPRSNYCQPSPSFNSGFFNGFRFAQILQPEEVLP